MERKSLLDPTNSSDGQFEEINLEEGAADGSKAFRAPAGKVDLESLRRTPVWNVVVNSVTYMASASQPFPSFLSTRSPSRPPAGRTNRTSPRMCENLGSHTRLSNTQPAHPSRTERVLSHGLSGGGGGGLQRRCPCQRPWRSRGGGGASSCSSTAAASHTTREGCWATSACRCVCEPVMPA